MKSIRLAFPDVEFFEIQNELKQIIESGVFTKGKFVKQFEEIIAEYVGTKYAFSTTSGTTALHLSLVVLGIEEGDEVLIPDFTFPATANVVVQQKATPVFVDINLNDLTIDILDLRKKISTKSKAIIPVHPFGYPANMSEILKIAEENNLFIIEDAACAIGSSFGGKKCGSFGHTGCFSFHPRKVISTGEGGMITTTDENIAKKIDILRNHGGILKNQYFSFIEAGFNYRMSEIQAALGIEQMKKLDKILKKRISIANIYNDFFDDVELLSKVKPTTEIFYNYQSYVVLLDERIDRDEIIGKLGNKGIETTLGTYALHCQPFYQKKFGYRTGQLNSSYIAFNQSLALPIHTKMTEEDAQYVAKNLISNIRKC